VNWWSYVIILVAMHSGFFETHCILLFLLLLSLLLLLLLAWIEMITHLSASLDHSVYHNPNRHYWPRHTQAALNTHQYQIKPVFSQLHVVWVQQHYTISGHNRCHLQTASRPKSFFLRHSCRFQLGSVHTHAHRHCAVCCAPLRVAVSETVVVIWPAQHSVNGSL